MSDSSIDDFRTIKEVREEVFASLDVGVRCPCCNQFAKRYRRKLTSAMAYGLILIYKYFRLFPNLSLVHLEDYFKSIPNIPSSIRGDCSKLRYWGLIFKSDGSRGDGNPSNGYYGITSKGNDFVRGLIKVPKNIFIYNDEFDGFDGVDVSIVDCLGEKFDYSELMGGG